MALQLLLQRFGTLADSKWISSGEWKVIILSASIQTLWYKNKAQVDRLGFVFVI
jgi:hypothetical protein